MRPASPSSPRSCDCCKDKVEFHLNHHSHGRNRHRSPSPRGPSRSASPATPKTPQKAKQEEPNMSTAKSSTVSATTSSVPKMKKVPSATSTASSSMQYEANYNLQLKQRENLLSILRDEKFTDLKFVVGPNQTVINANRVFLASVSKTFEKLLYPDNPSETDSAIKEVHFPDISDAAFQSVLNFAYNNDPQITADNVLSLKYICERFEIDTLGDICSEFWASNLTPDSLCSLLNQAVIINSTEFIKQCMECIKKFAFNADVMLNSPGFSMMNLKSMIIFLLTDGLKIEEHKLWQYILIWADYQSVNEESAELLNKSQSYAGFGQKTQSLQSQISVEVETLKENEELKADQVDKTPGGDFLDNIVEEEHSVNYDDVGNRVGGDDYIESMAKDVNDDETDNNSEYEQVYVNDENLKKEPWNINVMQPKNQKDLLRCLKPYIRWGAMNGAYFVKEVIPLNLFDKNEIITILSYYQLPDEGCGVFMTEPRWSSLLKTKSLPIQRGDIELAKWTYPGGKRMDAVSFQVSADVGLLGIGVFDCSGSCTAQVKIYKGDNGKHKECMAESEVTTFRNGDSATSIPKELKFKEVVKLQQNEKYTVELLQKNEEEAISYQIKNGQECVRGDNEFQVTFSRAAASKNGTTVSKGAIPTMYFDL